MTVLNTSKIVEVVDQAVERIGRSQEAAIPLLQELQKQFRFLPKDALKRVCEITDITPADLEGVSTFYSQFRHSPMGRHLISVCHGTACHIKGANEVTEAIQRHLGLSADNDTSTDEQFTLQKVACLGCCTLAPAVLIDDVTYGHITAHQVPKMLEAFIEYSKQAKRASREEIYSQPRKDIGELRIGLGSCCVSRGSGKLLDALEETMSRTGIEVRIKHVGCVGMCHQTPLLEVIPPESNSHLYACVQPEDAEAILLKHFKPPGLFHKLQISGSSALESLLKGE